MEHPRTGDLVLAFPIWVGVTSWAGVTSLFVLYRRGVARTQAAEA